MCLIIYLFSRIQKTGKYRLYHYKTVLSSKAEYYNTEEPLPRVYTVSRRIKLTIPKYRDNHQYREYQTPSHLQWRW